MDAKVDDWVVTPRRGKAVEINALWYNALCLLDGWDAEVRRRPDGLDLERHADAAPASRSTGGSGTTTAAISTTSSTASRRRCGLPAEPGVRDLADHPVLDRERWEPVMKVVRERLLTPVGLRSLAPGHPGLQAAVLRRSALARRRLSPGHRLGLADRPVRRRLAEATRRTALAPALLDGFAQPSRGGVRRLDQRGLRRRSAVYSPRLRRAGLERRRSAALSGKDGRAAAERGLSG